MGKYIDLTNMRFGRLLVICKHGRNKFNQITWLCKCDCGNDHIISTNLLNRGTQSCGCLALEVRTKHGMHKDKIYRIWHNMHSRCRKANANYGARGISICEQWNDFETFYNDFGYTFPGGNFTIERINVDGNYELGNVKWATMKEQSLNKRNSKLDQNKIQTIRDLSSSGVGYAEIGRIMNIDPSHARKVAIGERC